ncbi:UbiD family decarboxylase [Aromatoleum buckelii]|uniref:UbiD family decarboxylase n=1 Tax=Aromatoleum buckelii TaxID=200254 RepID=A0ABX1N344_9RHOO|nr:UbiD family decarboxylase [Aromatoleum buckelii]MCK0513175.1 UbiD family decarboxylase [Aromatoleum buckelii]
MAYSDLRGFLADLGDDLKHVGETFDPRFEMAAVLRGLPAEAPAVMFDKVTGYPGARVAGNLIASRRRMAKAFGTSEERLAQTYLDNKAHVIAPVAAQGAAPAQEVVHRAPDDLLSLLPILTHHEKDAAPFITIGMVLCTDPATGRRGMGIHRMMVKGGGRLGILLANPPLSQFHANSEAAGRPLDVAIALGLEPATLLASVVRSGPQGPDKMAVAGGLRGAPVELARALTVDVEVPARAEIVIEGRVLPGVRETEGPFGENTGYYFSNLSPVIEVTAVTHRDNFIYPGLCPWSADVDMLLSLAAGTELLGQLQDMVAGVVDLEMTGGTAGFSAVVAVKACPRHEVRRLVMLALNLDRRLKTVTVVDDDIDIRDPREVAWAIATRYLPERDTVIIGGAEGYVIDPSSAGSSAGSKAGFVATRGPGPQFDKVTLPAAAQARARQLIAEILR